jgi:hypothetical protein
MSNDAVVLAQHEAPYTDPGVAGQSEISNESKSTVAYDSKAAGTPPQGTHSGNSTGVGERAASLFDRDAFKELELSERHTETSDVA